MKSLRLLAQGSAIAIAAMGMSFTTTANAQNSVWLPAPGSGNVSLSYVEQEADRFYIGESEMSLPFGTIKNKTFTLGAQFGLTDALALDAKLPSARRTSGLGKDSGIGDARLGITYRFVDEFETRGAPSVGLRLGAIIKGNYETQRPDSIGDGTSGVEASILIGKKLGPVGLSAELGVRDRNKGVPNETFFNVSANFAIGGGFAANVGFSDTRSSGNLDIGGPGFDPSKFQQVKEERQIVSAGVSYAVTRGISLSGNVGRVIDGRNTQKADIYGVGVAFDF
jgi:hypothetical protein